MELNGLSMHFNFAFLYFDILFFSWNYIVYRSSHEKVITLKHPHLNWKAKNHLKMWNSSRKPS